MNLLNMDILENVPLATPHRLVAQQLASSQNESTKELEFLNYLPLGTPHSQMAQQWAASQIRSIKELDFLDDSLLGTAHSQMAQQLVTSQIRSTKELDFLDNSLLGTPHSQMAQQLATSQIQSTKELDVLDMDFLDNLLLAKPGRATQISKKAKKRGRATQISKEAKKRGPATQSSEKAEKLGEENVFLPEELVEKIILKLPLPSLFRARFLSKAWYAKFRSTPEGLTPLQNELTDLYSKWTTYPVCLCGKNRIVGFDRISYQWKLMLTLSYLPLTDLIVASAPVRTFGASVGPLMLFGQYDYYVTNIFTRSWRQLRLPKSCKRAIPTFQKLLPGKSGTYKVLFVYIKNVHYRHHFRIPMKTVLYDSRLNNWTISQERMHINPENISSVYLHGKLYLITFCRAFRQWELYIYNVDSEDSDQKWKVMPLLFDSIGTHPYGVAILLCGQIIMMVTYSDGIPGVETNLYCRRWEDLIVEWDIQIYRLDLHTLQLVNIFKGSPKVIADVPGDLLNQKTVSICPNQYGSDENFIYFYAPDPGAPMLMYNVHTLKWTCFPHPWLGLGYSRPIMLGSPFGPEQSPFLWCEA